MMFSPTYNSLTCPRSPVIILGLVSHKTSLRHWYFRACHQQFSNNMLRTPNGKELFMNCTLHFDFNRYHLQILYFKSLAQKYFVLDKLLETDAPDIKHFITSIAHHCGGGQFKIKGKEDKMFNSFCQITYCINLRQSKTIVFYCFYISIT